MPNRILKESIFTSEKISSLNDFDFRVWISLILSADDNGCGDARPAIIRGHAFPLQEDVAARDIELAISRLLEAECIKIYRVDGRPYYHFPNWGKHQRIRQVKGKYPQPASDCGLNNEAAATCGELPQLAADCGLNPNPNPNTNPEAESESRRAPKPAAAVADHVDVGTVEVYLANNITGLNATLMQEFVSFKDDLPEELIRYAIDEACAQNVRSYGYLRKILNRYVERGFKTIGDVKADKAAFERNKQAKASPSKHNYQQHEYTDNDFGADFFYDPSKDYGGGV